MGKKALAVILIVLAVVALSMLVTVGYEHWLGPARSHQHHRPSHPFAFLRGELGLTKEQMSRLEERRNVFENDIRDVREELSLKRTELMDALKADSPDTTTVDRLVEEIGALQVRVEKQVIRHMMEEEKILTAEQREKFRSMFHRHFREREDKPWIGPGEGPMGEMGHGRGDEEPGRGHR